MKCKRAQTQLMVYQKFIQAINNKRPKTFPESKPKKLFRCLSNISIALTGSVRTLLRSTGNVKELREPVVTQCMMGESNHIHTQTSRHLSESLHRPRHMAIVTTVWLLHVGDGAHDTVVGRVAASRAGLRRRVRGVGGAGAGGRWGGPRGRALAALRGGRAPLVLGAAPLTFPKALRLFSHVLHDLLRHLHSLKTDHVHFQKAVDIFPVSVKADSKQDIFHSFVPFSAGGAFMSTIN